MGRHYDNWERLVEAVMRREQFRTLSLADSRSPSIGSIDSDFSSCSSSRQDSFSFGRAPSPLRKDLMELKLAQSVKEGKQSGRYKVLAKTRHAVWKGLSIFRTMAKKENFKDHGKEREREWGKAMRTLHGLEPLKSSSLSRKQNYEEVSLMRETAEMRAELARLQELWTLKGRIASLAKAKGVDLDSIHHYYTV